MKRITLMVCTVVGLAVGSSQAQASWGALGYSGYQPWWNIFAKRYKCLTPEEERLQKFWHDYYSAMKNFYCDLDHIDWVAYYKNHGYQINGGCGGYCGGRVNYAPVFVSPTMQWAVPYQSLGGPPMGPMGMPNCGPMGAGPGAMGPAPMGPGAMGPGYGYGPGCAPGGYGPPPMTAGYPGPMGGYPGYPGGMPPGGPGMPMTVPTSMSAAMGAPSGN